MAAQAFARLDMFDDARRYLKEADAGTQEAPAQGLGVQWSGRPRDPRDLGHARCDFAKDYRQFALDMLEAGVSDWTNTSLELTVARTAALLGDGAQAHAYFDKARQKLHPRTDDPRRAIIDYDQSVAHRLLATRMVKPF